MSRRASGEGNIYQREDGRWTARIQIGGKRFCVYGHTRKEAVDKLQELKSQDRTGTLVEPARLTVAAFLAQWLDAARLTRKPSTLHGYEDVVRVHLVPAFGTIKLQKLAPQHLLKLYQDKQAQGLSPRRIAIIHAVARTALEDAVKWRLIATNPVAAITPPRQCPKDRQLWTAEQLRQFIVAASKSTSPYAWALVILVGTGLRLSELLGLTWEDVDLVQGSLRVNKALVWAGKKPVWGPPKSKAGNRAVPLPPIAHQLVTRLQNWQAEAKLKKGVFWQNADDRIVCTGTGGVPTANSFKKTLIALCEESGIPRINVHGLRHHYASVLIGAGVDVKQAQILLGHSRPSVTLDIYSHVTGQDKGIGQLVEAALGESV
jgi:integrase